MQILTYDVGQYGFYRSSANILTEVNIIDNSIDVNRWERGYCHRNLIYCGNNLKILTFCVVNITIKIHLFIPVLYSSAPLILWI